MFLYFLLPLLAVVLIAYAASDPAHQQRWRWWRRSHFWLSIVYTITNFPHLFADMQAPDGRSDQITLMVSLVIFGLLINIEAWRWWRSAA